MLFSNLKTIYGFPDGKTVVAYNANGKEAIACGSESSGVKVYETNVEDEEYTSTDINEHMDSITCVAASKDGAFATGGVDGVAALYRSNNTFNKMLVRSAVPIRSLSFHPNGTKLAIATDENVIRIVLVADTSKIVQLDGHTCPVKSVDYHPTGDFLISSDIQGTIKIWDVSASSPVPKCVKTLPEFSYQSEIDAVRQTTVAWNPDESSFAFAGTNSDIRVFRADIWTPSYDLSGQHTSDIITFAWSPNGYYLASSAEDNSFVIWDTKTRKTVVTEVATAQITGIAWNPKENELTMTDMHGQVRVWKEVIPGNYPHPATVRNRPSQSSSQQVFSNKVKQEPAPKKKAPVPNLESLFDSAAEDDDEEGEDIDMMEELGEDVDEEDDDEDDEELGDFVIDDDGAGYVETEEPTTDAAAPQQKQQAGINLGFNSGAIVKKQRQLEDAFDPPTTFQPGETPYHKPEPGKSFEPAQGERRYMAYNLVGVISTIYEKDHSVINVEFHDQSEYRNFHFTDVYNYSMGAIGVVGTVFAVEGKETTKRNPKVKKELLDDDFSDDDEDDVETTYINSSLYFRPNKMGSNNKDWTHHMLPDEDVVSVAINRVSVIATTSLGFVRIFSISGVQRYVFSLENVVSITAMTDLAFIVYSPGPAFNNQQNLEYILVNTDTNEVLQKDKVQLSTDSQLNWIGFSETNQATTFDSAGVLRVLSRQRRPFQAVWVPVFDSKLHAESLQRAEKYWPVGVLRDRLMCVVLRGNNTYPFFPRPLVKDIPLKLPLLEQSDEIGQLEEKVLRIHTANVHERDEAEATNMDDDYAQTFAEADVEMDVALLKLINLACKSEKLSRAIDLTYNLHSEESMDKAIKIANYYRYSGLAERMTSIKEEKFMNDADLFQTTQMSASELDLDSDLARINKKRTMEDEDSEMFDTQFSKKSRPFQFS